MVAEPVMPTPRETDAETCSGESLMEIEVAYATPERQLIVSLQVPAGTTVARAIEASGIREEFPQIEAHPAVGIFSRKVPLDTELLDGDRVEIYRPLAADPKEMRRRRAEEERLRKQAGTRATK